LKGPCACYRCSLAHSRWYCLFVLYSKCSLVHAVGFWLVFGICSRCSQ
jgi:hypothetical protein